MNTERHTTDWRRIALASKGLRCTVSIRKLSVTGATKVSHAMKGGCGGVPAPCRGACALQAAPSAARRPSRLATTRPPPPAPASLLRSEKLQEIKFMQAVMLYRWHPLKGQSATDEDQAVSGKYTNAWLCAPAHCMFPTSSCNIVYHCNNVKKW